MRLPWYESPVMYQKTPSMALMTVIMAIHPWGNLKKRSPVIKKY
jgi:hypothetical protein